MKLTSLSVSVKYYVSSCWFVLEFTCLKFQTKLTVLLLNYSSLFCGPLFIWTNCSYSCATSSYVVWQLTSCINLDVHLLLRIYLTLVFTIFTFELLFFRTFIVQKCICHLETNILAYLFVVQEPRGQYRDLMVKDFRRTTLLLWPLWFAVACVYYGIVLSQSEILERGGVCAGEKLIKVKKLLDDITRYLLDFGCKEAWLGQIGITQNYSDQKE